MGKLAYILDAMERKPSTEEVISERINETDVKTSQMFQALINRMGNTITEINSRIDALEGAYTAQLQNLTKGIDEGLNTLRTGVDGAQKASIDDLKGELSKIIKKVEDEARKLQKPDRTDEVLKAVSGVNNTDVLMALRNIPELDLSPVMKEMGRLEKKLDKPSKWVFDVERDMVNDITQVVAREQVK